MDLGQIQAVRGGDRTALARLLSVVDRDIEQAATVVRELEPTPRRATVVGLTGAAGAGKSTLAAALVDELRRRLQRVAVLAVDPSSPYTGGALLGDRIRLQRHAADPAVFVRSLATRGQTGGLAAAVPAAVRVLDVAGFDVVLVESVGTGQTDVEVADLADTTVVVLAPGMGDSVQANKAGILETADVFVVNKADRDGAETLRRDLDQMLDLGVRGAWRPPIVTTVASEGRGIDELWLALCAHRAHLVSSGELSARRRRRQTAEILGLVMKRAKNRLADPELAPHIDELTIEVLAGRSDPLRAADELVHRVFRAPVQNAPSAWDAGAERRSVPQ